MSTATQIVLGLTPSQRVLVSVISAIAFNIALQLAQNAAAWGIPLWAVNVAGLISSAFVVIREWYGYAHPPAPQDPPV